VVRYLFLKKNLLKYTLCSALMIASPVFSEDTTQSDTTLTTPEFLIAGRPLKDADLSSVLRGSYLAASLRFPNFRSCLLDTEVSMLDSNFDFEKIGSLQELEVCVFWISTELTEPRKIKYFLQRSGFIVAPDIIYPKSVMQKFGSSVDGLIIDSFLKFEKVPPAMLPIFDRIIGLHGMSLSILLSGDQSVLNVTASFNRL
jgi:hypothetical protein